MTLKMKDKKIIWTKLFLHNFISLDNFNCRGLFVHKGSGSGISPDPDPDPGNPKRPDPQH